MKKSYIYTDRHQCTGCEACANACSKGALTMQSDWRGFKYPIINSKLCIDCGKCQKTCPVNSEHLPFIFPHAKAFVDKNKHYLSQASSGGAFGVIARYVIKKNGTVFGASMDEDYNVKFIGIDNFADLSKLQGTKYVQAYAGDVYCQVRKALNDGKYVFFCGCPCQVDGLYHFLNRDYQHLITMDLICHGVPSQPYFKEYVKDLLSQRVRQGIKQFRFRWKPGACDFSRSIQEKAKLYIGNEHRDYYMTYFCWGKGYRDSCYLCRYAGGRRPADFTVGDFFNGKKMDIEIDDSYGASQVLFNTNKAILLEPLFDKAGFTHELSSVNEAIGGTGGQLTHPSKYDIRCKLIYIMRFLFGLKGTKFLFWLDSLRMRG